MTATMGLWKRKITADDAAIGQGTTLTLKQSLVPCTLVTILFFLWGFAYGLLDVLNSHFQADLNITAAKASGLSAAYFGAYFLCPLTMSGWILRHYGFRVTFMTGLAILTVGCLLFWPSGVKASFGGFCGSMFVVGAGLSTLETGADSFLSICGPPRYLEIRLNVAQGVQGVGSFVAPLLASRVLLAKTVDTAQGLKNVQWVYLGVACFVALLIILFFLAPFPEITDADMGVQEHEITAGDIRPLSKQVNLFLGTWSQFCYVGAQVAVLICLRANYFINFAEEAGYDAAMARNLLAVGQGLYAFNRFLAAGLMAWSAIKPRYVLAVYLGLCLIFGLAATLSSGKASVAMLILVLCFESACFATIFSLALRGLGRHTKRGGSFLVAAISGGAFIPPMTGLAATSNANSPKAFHHAMAIHTAFYVLAWVFSIYVNVFKKDTMNDHRNADLTIDQNHTINVKEIEVKRHASGTVPQEAGKGANETIEKA